MAEDLNLAILALELLCVFLAAVVITRLAAQGGHFIRAEQGDRKPINGTLTMAVYSIAIVIALFLVLRFLIVTADLGRPDSERDAAVILDG